MRLVGAALSLLCATAAFAATTLLAAEWDDGRGHARHSSPASAGGGLAVTGAGSPLMVVENMAPGQVEEATVRIANRAPGPRRFSLATARQSEAEGLGGGLLSEVLRARVVPLARPRRRSGNRPRPLFVGRLAGLSRVPLGTWAPGKSRRFHLIVRFPRGGTSRLPAAGDNALQSARLSVDFVWRARRA